MRAMKKCIQPVAVVNSDRAISTWGDGNTVEKVRFSGNFAGILFGGNGIGTADGAGINAQCPSLILQNMVYNNGETGQENIVLSGSGCNQFDNNPQPGPPGPPPGQ
jgi:hypothetical protein